MRRLKVIVLLRSGRTGSAPREWGYGRGKLNEPLETDVKDNEEADDGRPRQGQAPLGAPELPTLPDGWGHRWGPVTAQAYYCNTVTNVTQWEEPLLPAVPFANTAVTAPVVAGLDDATREKAEEA